MKYSKEEIADCKAKLLKLLPPGATVYTKLNHVSRSGMMCSITPFVVIDNEPRYLAWSIAVLFGQSRDKYDGIRMDGCGMDMGFSLVYNLSSILYPEGFDCIGQDRNGRRYCPSNDHSNGDRNYKKHHHSSGGYALRQSWL